MVSNNIQDNNLNQETQNQFFLRMMKIPCTLKFNEDKQKWIKTGFPDGWSSDKRDRYNGEANFAVYTGSTNNITVLDFDDNGFEEFLKIYPKINEVKTLITKTPNGGLHMFFEYEADIKSTTKWNKFNVDILNDNRLCTQGFKYDVINNCEVEHNGMLTNEMKPYSIAKMPEDLKMFLLYQHEVGQVEACSIGYEEKMVKVNKILGVNYDWKVGSHNVLVPQTNICLVSNKEHDHYQSYLVYNGQKKILVLKCHGNCGSKRVSFKTEKQDEERESNEFILFQEVLRVYNRMNLRKVGDILYQQVPDKPAVYMPYKNTAEFLKEVFNEENDKYKLFHQKPKYNNDMLTYMENSASFKTLERDLDYIGFQNGILNLRNIEFLKYEDINEGLNCAVRNYIDEYFDIDKLDTPVFDEIVKYQLTEEEVFKYFQFAIGRCFFTPQEDNLQIMFHIKGASGTAKSTITENVIEYAIGSSFIGQIDKNFEPRFGLEGIYDKELIISKDTPQNISSVLDAETFQKMVSGEEISIPRKNKKAGMKIKWKTCIITCGNYWFDYKNEQFLRRVVPFLFDNRIPSHMKDTTLSFKLRKEVPAIIYKCVLEYKKIIAEYTGKDFWNFCPQYFKTLRAEILNSYSVVNQFINDPGEANSKGMRYYVCYTEGHYESWATVKNKFDNWYKIRYGAYTKYNLEVDDEAWALNGFVVKKMHVCKSCQEKAQGGKEKCCKNYHINNRVKKYMIENMKLVVGEEKNMGSDPELSDEELV